MSASVRWEGLEDLRTGLRQVTGDLVVEARRLAREAVLTAQADMVRQYPRRTGHLRREVQIVPAEAGPFGVGLRIISRARYARFVDARLRVFVPVMVRRRAQFLRALVELVRQAGFEVRAS